MQPIVFDCFTFFNELELLELRLDELSSVVDWFVLVEAARTFTDRPKPLVFRENRERFSKYLHKIIAIALPYLPAAPATTWAREAFQRDAIAYGVGHAGPEDYVMISDADEIPRSSAVENAIAAGVETAALCMPLYYYKFNCKNVAGESHEPHTVLTRRRLLSTPQAARISRHALPRIPDAGWHFSYLGDAERIRTKIDAFSHQELNRVEFTDPERLSARIAQGKDIFEREAVEWRYVPLDGTFPRFVQENRGALKHLIHDV